MRKPIWVVATMIGLAALFACSDMTRRSTRLSIEPSEAIYDYSIDFKLPKDEAFNRIEVWIAENYNDANQVTQLKNKGSGSIVLKPLVQYTVGGALVQYARYTLRINVSEAKVDLHFELGREVKTGTWAPQSEIPTIKANFQNITAGIAKTIEGTVKW
jgi:hypothetical protein